MTPSLPTSRVCFAALCSACCLLAPASASGQEIRWRTDYQQARREAAELGKPLVLDFGTESCFWCKQLDARTLRDPGIIALLNDNCIPLKVDANRSPALTEALQIASFPTLVFAGSDGRILGYQEGFVEAPKLKEMLQKTISAVSTPEWMTRDYQEAGKAIADADFARAITLLKNLVEDGKDRPVQTKSRQLLNDLEQQATGRLIRARQLLETGQRTEALAGIAEVAKSFAGTQAARDSDRLLGQLASRTSGPDPDRSKKAKDALAQAREEYKAQQFGLCLDRCETLAATYADLPEAAQALALANEIKSNPEWLKQACDQLGDRLAGFYLAMAESWLRKGQPQQAVFYLERVQQFFPNTRHSEAATVRLTQIQGLPMRQVDLKK